MFQTIIDEYCVLLSLGCFQGWVKDEIIIMFQLRIGMFYARYLNFCVNLRFDVDFIFFSR